VLIDNMAYVGEVHEYEVLEVLVAGATSQLDLLAVNEWEACVE